MLVCDTATDEKMVYFIGEYLYFIVFYSENLGSDTLLLPMDKLRWNQPRNRTKYRGVRITFTGASDY